MGPMVGGKEAEHMPLAQTGRQGHTGSALALGWRRSICVYDSVLRRAGSEEKIEALETEAWGSDWKTRRSAKQRRWFWVPNNSSVEVLLSKQVHVPGESKGESPSPLESRRGAMGTAGDSHGCLLGKDIMTQLFKLRLRNIMHDHVFTEQESKLARPRQLVSNVSAWSWGAIQECPSHGHLGYGPLKWAATVQLGEKALGMVQTSKF